MPAAYNTELVIGDTRRLVFPVTALDLQQEYEDLSDLADVLYTIVPSITSDDQILQFSLSDPEIELTTAGDIDTVEIDNVPDSTDVISIFLEPSNTEQLPTEAVEHELQIEDIGGNITTVMQGDIEPIPTAQPPRQS
jgi:hypothetical protein